MKDDWLPLWSRPAEGPDAACFEAALRAESPWFDGHFPGRPVVPGLAWLALAWGALRRGEREAGRAVALSGFSQVRFRRLVEPPADARVVLAPPEPPAACVRRFEIRVGEETVCQGRIEWRAAEAPESPRDAP